MKSLTVVVALFLTSVSYAGPADEYKALEKKANANQLVKDMLEKYKITSGHVKDAEFANDATLNVYFAYAVTRKDDSQIGSHTVEYLCRIGGEELDEVLETEAFSISRAGVLYKGLTCINNQSGEVVSLEEINKQ